MKYILAILATIMGVSSATAGDLVIRNHGWYDVQVAHSYDRYKYDTSQIGTYINLGQETHYNSDHDYPGNCIKAGVLADGYGLQCFKIPPRGDNTRHIVEFHGPIWEPWIKEYDIPDAANYHSETGTPKYIGYGD